jgi:hypothetical protein
MFASRTLTSGEKKYPPAQLEALCLVWAFHKFRHLLWGHQFPISVITDNRGVEFLEKAKSSSMLLRWSLSVQEFNFEIKHRPGRLGPNVDTLSRFPVGN